VSKEEFEKIKQEYMGGGFQKLVEGEEKYGELKKKALRKYAFILNSYDIEGNYSDRCKNAHWIFDGFNTEDVKAVASILNAKRGMYSYSIGTEIVEFFFGCSVIKGGTNLKYCFNLASSSDCAYYDSLVSSSNCIASVGLRHKEYCILNKQYSKEDYFDFIKQYDLGSYKTYKEVERLAHEHWKKYPPDPDVSTNVIDCTGSHIFESKNCKECYEAVGAEDCKYMLLMATGPVRDCYDISEWGLNLSLSYDSMSIGTNASDIKFSRGVGNNPLSVEYSIDCYHVSNIFASIGLRGGEFTIFNKKYSEKEYYDFKKRIIEHMQKIPYRDARGNSYSYGEFFPIEMSPHTYNETIALNFFPLTKEEAIGNNYKWRDPDINEYKFTIKAIDLPDHIKDVNDSLTKEIIACVDCGRGFRVLQEELIFRRSMNVPLARQCPFCRINEKFQAWVKKMRVGNRTCAKCNTTFPTYYTEEDEPHILCKVCYLKEVV
jgi:hypothetical protein